MHLLDTGSSPGHVRALFTRVTACTLALSPIRDTHSEGFSYLVTSIAAPAASGWSVCRVGLAPIGKAPPCHGAHPRQTSPILFSCDAKLHNTAALRYPSGMLCEATLG